MTARPNLRLGEWVAVCRLDDIVPDTGVCALVNGVQVAVFRLSGDGEDGGSVHAPWDYLGGLLVCTEAGARVVDVQQRPLATADPNARRHLVAAGTPELLAALTKAAM